MKLKALRIQIILAALVAWPLVGSAQTSMPAVSEFAAGKTPTASLGIINSLTLPGYAFELMLGFNQGPRLSVDSAPGMVLVPQSSANSNAVGFTASFNLANATATDRTFTFPAPYYASLRVGFRVLDSNDNVVWQSYQLLVDIPPQLPPATLTLPHQSSWSNQVFVPVYKNNQVVLGPGNYTLEAEVLGTPAYSVRSAFTVGIIVVDPVLPPVGLH